MSFFENPDTAWCRLCDSEFPFGERVYLTGVGWVCPFCDSCEESFAELLEPEDEEATLCVHRMRANGGGYWVTRGDAPGKRLAATLMHLGPLISETAVDPHFWPYAKWPGQRGMWMSYGDRQALGLCQKREWL